MTTQQTANFAASMVVGFIGALAFIVACWVGFGAAVFTVGLQFRTGNLATSELSGSGGHMRR